MAHRYQEWALKNQPQSPKSIMQGWPLYAVRFHSLFTKDGKAKKER